MKVTFSLLLPRDAQTVPVVRRLCRDTLNVLGVTEDCLGSIELAVSEACTNVLNHVVGTPDEYEVELAVDEGACTISIVDTGTGFDHDLYQSDDAGSLSVSSEGGRGIFLMRQMVDSLEFTSEPAKGTVVHLLKKLDFQPHATARRLESNAS